MARQPVAHTRSPSPSRGNGNAGSDRAYHRRQQRPGPGDGQADGRVRQGGGQEGVCLLQGPRGSRCKGEGIWETTRIKSVSSLSQQNSFIKERTTALLIKITLGGWDCLLPSLSVFAGPACSGEEAS